MRSFSVILRSYKAYLHFRCIAERLQMRWHPTPATATATRPSGVCDVRRKTWAGRPDEGLNLNHNFPEQHPCGVSGFLGCMCPKSTSNTNGNRFLFALYDGPLTRPRSSTPLGPRTNRRLLRIHPPLLMITGWYHTLGLWRF